MGSYLDALLDQFAVVDKHEAHRRSAPVLADMAADPAVVRDALRRRMASSGGLLRGHYPVISLDVASNPHFDLVLNCWLPLPDASTDLSTKAIHHHGPLLLTSTTAFGPGYEHWLFSQPEAVDPARELFRSSLLERSHHGLHHQSFVDARIAHVPFYVPSLTITLALWSTSTQTTWKDRVKRVPFLQRRSSELRRLATRVGLGGALDLKNVDYYDFSPVPGGFVGMRDREEFGLGPVDDHLHSVFHVVQATGNQDVLRDIPPEVADHPTVRELTAAVDRDELIRPRLSAGHADVPFANFRSADILQALAAADAWGA